MLEFTGERVIPAQVNTDLWNEHIARYAFASRYATGKRALDIGCGTGYGTAELARTAQHVSGLDLAQEAVDYARSNYRLDNTDFFQSSCTALPVNDRVFDLVVAFELIEHLSEWKNFLSEAGRVLSPDGLFIVSTPNKRYYAESRKGSGANPHHHHEFEYEEFAAALREVFPSVVMLLQNRAESFAFYPAKTFWPVDARVDGDAGCPDDAHFFVALAGFNTAPEERSFVYVPRAANILREREQHVELLEKELTTTQDWLQEVRGERDALLDLHRKQQAMLEANNRWAADLNVQLKTAGDRILELQDELVREQAVAVEVAAGYQAKVEELEQVNRDKTAWAIETDARLSREISERTAQLTQYVDLLHQAEAMVEERSLWALRAQREFDEASSRLNLVRASRWVKLGRRLGLGPAL